MIVIDTITYNIPIKVLKRKAEFLYKYAERTEDGVLHSELIGVYLNFDVQCGMSSNNVTDYAALYLKVTEPVTSHEVTFLGDTFDAYFAGVSDDVAKDYGSSQFYRDLVFSVIAISPTRTP
jgi:hypothetical protein